jgi:hypothetical protein
MPQQNPRKNYRGVETLVTYDVVETLTKLRVEETEEESRDSLQQFVVASILKTVHQNQPILPEQWAAKTKSLAKKVQLQEDKDVVVKATPVQHEIRQRDHSASQSIWLHATRTYHEDYLDIEKNFEKLDLTWSIRVEKAQKMHIQEQTQPLFSPSRHRSWSRT